MDCILLDVPKIADAFFKEFSIEYLEEKSNAAKQKLETLTKELAKMETIKLQVDKAANSSNWFGNIGLVFLTVQWCILFRMVFFTFDWNLMEPVTYFVGYTTMMIGILWYCFTKTDYDYNNVREFLIERKRNRLHTKNQFDMAKYESLQVEIIETKRQIQAFSLSKIL
jgi:hypothetical protein